MVNRYRVTQFDESDRLKEEIRKNFVGLGYEC
jgi:hypothetical protein